MITGIDISEKNGSVNLADIDAGDIHFVFIKASEALDSADRCFADNLDNARENEFLTGAYHWLHPRLHAGQQAAFFLETVGDFTHLLPPVVCLEQHRASINEIGKSVKAFLDILEEEVGVKPIIYTSAEYWQKYMENCIWACEYPLWLDMPGSNWPPQLHPWAGWSFWQFAYQARLPGVPALLGLNRFNGTLNELKSMVIQ